MRKLAFLLMMFTVVAFGQEYRANASEAAEKAEFLFNSTDAAQITSTLNYFRERKSLDSVGVLLLAMRFSAFSEEIGEVLHEITGEQFGEDWIKWMVWHEQQLEIASFEGFEALHADVHSKIDGNFRLFLGSDKTYKIRPAEITWGGVKKDGIPALTNPKLLRPEDATYMEPENLVFGVSINGDARAYPLRILNWHEMFNDVVGGVPVSLAYCTLCGSGILFETKVEGLPYPLTLGSSGFLYRSNKLMYDTYTHSLWNQFTGEPVVGPLVGSGIKLKVRPVVITTWANWLEDNPETKVISVETGFRRDYGSGVAYKDYFASDDLMFPAAVDTTNHKAKDYVFSLRHGNSQKAWPINLFEGGKVINDRIDEQAVVLIGDAAGRTVRAYDAGGIEFAQQSDLKTLSGGDTEWTVREEFLESADGRKLARLPGHIGFWFAWQNYYGSDGEVAEAQ